MTTRSTVPDTRIYWEQQPGGWLHLLPALAGTRLLAFGLDPAVTWMLASRCRELVVVDPLPAPPQRAAVPACPNVRTLERAALARWLDEDAAAGGARFDGAVLHDPAGSFLNARSWPGLADALQCCRPRLSETAFLHLVAANRWAPQRLLRRWRSSAERARAPEIAARSWPARLQALGFGACVSHPLVAWSDQIAEVVAPSGYRPTRNPGLWKERIKSVLLGPRGCGRFAGAYAVLAGRAGLPVSVLDDIRAEVDRRLPVTGGPLDLKQYLVLAGHKSILTLGRLGDERADRVVVVAEDSLSIQRREVERQHLMALAQLPPVVADLIPRELSRFQVGASQCFVLSHMAGITIDTPAGDIDGVSEQALDFLVHLQRQRAGAPAAGVTGDAVDRFIDAACRRNQPLAAEIESWRERLRAQVSASGLRRVWMHGDYKVENVMFDPRWSRLTGVIDWEHAQPDGLPLLDLCYLLLYNRIIRGEDWVSATRRLFVDWQLSPPEARSLTRYCGEAEVPAAALTGLAALFFAHHVGHRMHLEAETVGSGEVLGLAQRLGAGIGQLPLELVALFAR